MGSPTTGTPNAGGVGKITFSTGREVSGSDALLAENLCPSAAMVCIHDGMLAEEYSV